MKNYLLSNIIINQTNSFLLRKTDKIKFVTTLNTEILLLSMKNKRLKKILNSEHSIVTVDGQWIIFALKRKYKNIDIVKNSGSDLIYNVAKECKEQNKKLLILGSIPEINKKAVKKLKNLNNYEGIYGYSPPFSPYPFSDNFKNEIEIILKKIKPNIIITAFGVPKQEYWAEENKNFLESLGVEYIMFFGGAVDMVAGKLKRAPKVFQKIGLEGVYRLFLEPNRIKRYYKLIKIIPMILLNKL